MPSLEQLISVLLPILPEAEVSQDDDGQIVILTGLMMPTQEASPRFSARPRPARSEF